jgi:hypothetical protein
MLYKNHVTKLQDSLAIYQSSKKKAFSIRLLLQTFLATFSTNKKWIDSKSIGEVRHIRWHLSNPQQDLSDSYNWRLTSIAAGYFDDLATD